jgi:hypothetical protein
MKKLCMVVCSALVSSFCIGQVVTTDPVLTAALIANGTLENSSMNDIKKKQTAIESLQATTASAVSFINSWQQKTYNGLLYVSSSVKSAYQVYECYKILQSIIDNESKMISTARKNPLALAFALKFQTDMITRATNSYAQISELIIKENDSKLLMDAGERMRLLNQVMLDLKVIEALAASSYFHVKWAVSQGIINTLNPFQGLINRDANIVKDIMGTWKF